MRTFLEAVTGFPTFLFTVPLLVGAGFWLLVAVGAADSRTFDGDADLGALGLGGVPVAVAFSLWTGFAWAGSLGTVTLLQPSAFSWPTRALTGLATLITASSVAWWATRVIVRMLRRLHPDGPGPSTHSVGPIRTASAELADDGALQSDSPVPQLHGRRRAA
ncbi:hypothetical protein [Streptomyces neyagawaensis]|uniref:hypothetical protein n=1 Tax=Streptomyces neyagawaensis TaxID=42238 RepID=UPI0007C75D2D|nr:hypothetical protein [Streptomyces neyagawaensis]MCL6738520.1 hypothetical protein [Streptomyces neyagawaensis]MDE1688920.1 hypothetical protein [Streptomyces neyagawaensis]